jgi:hypothetical protein
VTSQQQLEQSFVPVYLFVVRLTTLLAAQTVASDDTTINGKEIIWTEAVMA